nr:hypothetical protein [Enterococcus sp. DIV0212c]
MKDKNNYYQHYRMYYFYELMLLIGWVVNFILFSKFYEEAFFYVDKKANFIVQLLFMVNFYLEDILKYLFITFLLMTLNLFLILMFYIKNKKELTDSKKMTYSLIVFLVILGINGVAMLKTIVWPLFLLLFIASLTIVFIIYVITKYLYEEKDEFYEENEVVKKQGSFQTKEEAEQYAKDFITHWLEYFEKKGYTLMDSITEGEENEWYVEVIVQAIT